MMGEAPLPGKTTPAVTAPSAQQEPA